MYGATAGRPSFENPREAAWSGPLVNANATATVRSRATLPTDDARDGALRGRGHLREWRVDLDLPPPPAQPVAAHQKDGEQGGEVKGDEAGDGVEHAERGSLAEEGARAEDGDDAEHVEEPHEQRARREPGEAAEERAADEVRARTRRR